MSLLLFLKPIYADIGGEPPSGGGWKKRKKKKKKPKIDLVKLLPEDVTERFRRNQEEIHARLIKEQLEAYKLHTHLIEETKGRLDKLKRAQEEEEEVVTLFILDEF